MFCILLKKHKSISCTYLKVFLLCINTYYFEILSAYKSGPKSRLCMRHIMCLWVWQWFLTGVPWTFKNHKINETFSFVVITFWHRSISKTQRNKTCKTALNHFRRFWFFFCVPMHCLMYYAILKKRK